MSAVSVLYNITALNVELSRRLLGIQLAKLHSMEAQRSKGNERRTPPSGSFVSQGVEATWRKDATRPWRIKQTRTKRATWHNLTIRPRRIFCCIVLSLSKWHNNRDEFTWKTLAPSALLIAWKRCDRACMNIQYEILNGQTYVSHILNNARQDERREKKKEKKKQKDRYQRWTEQLNVFQRETHVFRNTWRNIERDRCRRIFLKGTV